MNSLYILLIIATFVFLVIKMLGYKARTGRYIPKVDPKKATYMFVFFAWIGFVVTIIYLAWTK